VRFSGSVSNIYIYIYIHIYVYVCIRGLILCTFIPYCSSYEGSGIHDDLKSRKYLQCEEVLWPMSPQSQTGAEVVRIGRLQLLVQVWI
jgi:hypothetical protein